MMTTISGIVMVVLAGVVLAFSRPRGGKTAGFVGTPYEPYAVVAIISGIFIGLLLIASEAIQLL